MTENRIEKYDNAKGILIFLVVFAHTTSRFLKRSAILTSIHFWIYLFHMPAFIFLAGIFSANAIRNDRAREKASRFLFLYLFMQVIFYLNSVSLKGFKDADFSLLFVTGIPWFCLGMFWWYLITAVLRKFSARRVFCFAVMTAVLSGYIEWPGGFLSIRRVINFYPFFYAGYVCDRHLLMKKLEFKGARSLAVLIQMVCLILSFWLNGFIPKFASLLYCYNSYREIWENGAPLIPGAAWRLLSYLVSAVLTWSVLSVSPSRRTIFSYLGKRSLPVYVFHGLLISFPIGHLAFLREWFLSGHLEIKCFLYAILVTILSLLPVFGKITEQIMNIRHTDQKDHSVTT